MQKGLVPLSLDQNETNLKRIEKKQTYDETAIFLQLFRAVTKLSAAGTFLCFKTHSPKFIAWFLDTLPLTNSISL